MDDETTIYDLLNNIDHFLVLMYSTEVPHHSNIHIQKANALIINILCAFKDVTLEDGIGLWEARAIDNWQVHISSIDARKKDEKNDWKKLRACDLGPALAFFDSKGMRFHLPAYLILDIIGENTLELDRYLTQKSYQDRFKDFTTEQKNIIKEYLMFLTTEENYFVQDLQNAIDFFSL